MYNDSIRVKSTIKYEKYDVNELDKSRIICQIQKTGNTFFCIKEVQVEIEHLKLPISQLNALRREAIEKFEADLEKMICRKAKKEITLDFKNTKTQSNANLKINLYLQKWNENVDYSKLDYHQIYVPFKDLIKAGEMRDCIAILPNILEEQYEKIIRENRAILQQVKGVMISHLSQIELLKRLDFKQKIMANDTLNITNYLSEKVIQNLGISRFTFSPELDKKMISSFKTDLEKEVVVYGRTCLMTSKYCPIGKNANCGMACQKGEYELQDRKDFQFPVIADNVNCHTRIYNSKILSITPKCVKSDFIRIDLLHENEQEIQKIISVVKAGERFAGEKYTNGNILTK